MITVVQVIALGLASGALYAVSALGIVVVYRSSQVINLANGALAMTGGYSLYLLRDTLGLPVVAAVPLAVLASCALSALVYVLVIRPLAKASTLARLIATLAVYLVVQATVQLIFGPVNKVPLPILPIDSIQLGGIALGADQLIIIATGILLAAVLWVVYRFTSFGLATTAVSENPAALAALGRSEERVRAANWMIAGLLGGTAGVLIAPIIQLTPGSFMLLLVPSLAAAVLGGFRSFPLTLVAGMAIGAVQVLSARYIPVPGVRDAVPFVILIVVLLLLGKSLPGRNFVTERLPRVGSGQIRPLVVVLVLGVVAVLTYTVFDYAWVMGAVVLGGVAIVALSQVLITGYAGQLSLAQMTMAGLGGLVAAQASVVLGTPFLVSLLIAVVVAIPIGILVGLPALRARGSTLAIATVGLGVAIAGTVLASPLFNGGELGLAVEAPRAFGIDLSPILQPRNYLMVTLVLLAIVALGLANLRRGRVGRRLLAIRTNEKAAAAMGISVVGGKLYAFVLAGMIAAVGGTLLLFRNPAVVVGVGFDAFSSFTLAAFSVLGGIGYVAGALIAGAMNPSGLVAVALGDVLGAFDVEGILTVWFPLIGGLALLIQLIFQPSGIVDAIVHPRDTERRRRRQAAARTRRPGPLARLLGTRAAREDVARARISAQLAEPAPRGSRGGAALAVRGVTVRYGSVVAVQDVSFEVAPGEVLSIIGPNGAGKTTLMDAITGFTRATGAIELDGEDISRWAPHRRARAGVVRSFQTLELLEDMTVLDNLRVAGDLKDVASYVLDLARPGRARLEPATRRAIVDFHLEDRLFEVPPQLSYGDRRVVAIARAIAGDPAILLLDEPAAGLSPAERENVAQVIRRIADEWGVGVLLIEHDVALVRRVSDRVLALDFGQTILTGTAADVLADPRVIDAYLGAPIGDDDRIEPAEVTR